MFFLLFSFIGMIAIEAVYFLNQALYAFYLLPILYYSVNLPEDITVTELGKYILANVGYSFSWQQFGLPISGFAEIQSTSLSNYLINRFILSVLPIDNNNDIYIVSYRCSNIGGSHSISCSG